MTDWYVYHSAKTMDRRYGNPEPNCVFSTSEKKKLRLDDNIWVVEGFGELPKTFYLVAHFVYKQTVYQPLPSPYKGGKYSNFIVMYTGPGKSYGSKINLSFEDHPWFKELHAKYITKQKFFNELSSMSNVTRGLYGIAKP